MEILFSERRCFVITFVVCLFNTAFRVEPRRAHLNSFLILLISSMIVHFKVLISFVHSVLWKNVTFVGMPSGVVFKTPKALYF